MLASNGSVANDSIDIRLKEDIYICLFSVMEVKSGNILLFKSLFVITVSVILHYSEFAVFRYLKLNC